MNPFKWFLFAIFFLACSILVVRFIPQENQFIIDAIKSNDIDKLAIHLVQHDIDLLLLMQTSEQSSKNTQNSNHQHNNEHQSHKNIRNFDPKHSVRSSDSSSKSHGKTNIDRIHFSSNRHLLHICAMHGKVETLDWILNETYYQTVDPIKINDLRTPLHLASIYGTAELVELLLNKGANVHAAALNDWTAILFATIWSNHDIVKLLIKNGASINDSVQNGLNGLQNAIVYSDAKMIEIYLDQGATLRPGQQWYEDFQGFQARYLKHKNPNPELESDLTNT